MIRRLCAILVVVSIVAVLVSPLVDLESSVYHRHHRACAGAQMQTGMLQAIALQPISSHYSHRSLPASAPSLLLAPLRC